MQNGSPATKAKNRYKSKAYDRIEFFVPKGQKATLQDAADRTGESMNGYVNQAVLEKAGLARWPQDGEEPPQGDNGMPLGRSMTEEASRQLAEVQTSFSIDIMERLNESADLDKPVSGVLESIRMFFGFGCGFIYEADHRGVFHLTELTSAYYYTELPEELPLTDLLEEALSDELSARKFVIFPADAEPGPLEKALEELFDARSIILIPIRDQMGRVMALVGLTDRRGMARHQDVNMDFAYAMLAALANHIKLRMYQVRIESTQKSLESILDHMGVDIYVNDFETHEILYANRSMAAPYGGVDNLVGATCWQALYNDRKKPCDFCPQDKLVDENGERSKVYSWDYQRPFDGSWFRVLSSAFRWVDGRLAHVVSSIDITENKNNEELIRRLADYDGLTELPNRRKLLDDCDALISADAENGYLLFFDLDGFKNVNDTLGHQAGDNLLHSIGQYLEFDPLFKGRSYRHSGDEFVILARDNLFDLVRAAERLLARFAAPWRIPEGDVTCNTSIGIARFPQDDTTTNGILNKADQAMYRAKQSGKGQIRFYDGGAFSTLDEYLAVHSDGMSDGRV